MDAGRRARWLSPKSRSSSFESCPTSAGTCTRWLKEALRVRKSVSVPSAAGSALSSFHVTDSELRLFMSDRQLGSSCSPLPCSTSCVTCEAEAPCRRTKSCISTGRNLISTTWSAGGVSRRYASPPDWSLGGLSLSFLKALQAWERPASALVSETQSPARRAWRLKDRPRTVWAPPAVRRQGVMGWTESTLAFLALPFAVAARLHSAHPGARMNPLVSGAADSRRTQGTCPRYLGPTESRAEPFPVLRGSHADPRTPWCSASRPAYSETSLLAAGAPVLPAGRAAEALRGRKGRFCWQPRSPPQSGLAAVAALLLISERCCSREQHTCARTSSSRITCV